jgi:hypothetical protein
MPPVALNLHGADPGAALQLFLIQRNLEVACRI